jgi:hypothetical protein
MGSTVIQRVAWKGSSFEDFEIDPEVKCFFVTLYHDDMGVHEAAAVDEKILNLKLIFTAY